MKELFNINAHIGQKLWQPSTSSLYIGRRLNINIVNLHFTELYLNRMLLFVYNLAKDNGHIIFVTNHRDTKLILDTAKILNSSYSINRWIGGTLTNWKQLIKSPLQVGINGTFPNLMVVLNPEENQAAIHEANILQIPVISILDSGSKTKGIDYFIPGNDQQIKFMVLDLIIRAIKLAQKEK